MSFLSSWRRPSATTEKPKFSERPFLVLGIILGVPGLVILGLLYAYNPADSHIFPPCPFRFLAHVYCPGCGALRATHCLLHGDLMGALRMNPLMVISMPVVAFLFLRPASVKSPAVAWVAFAILVAYGVARNIPAWPFALLAPR